MGDEEFELLLQWRETGVEASLGVAQIRHLVLRLTTTPHTHRHLRDGVGLALLEQAAHRRGDRVQLRVRRGGRGEVHAQTVQLCDGLLQVARALRVRQRQQDNGERGVGLVLLVEGEEIVQDGLHVLEGTHDVAADFGDVRLRVAPLRNVHADGVQHAVADFLARVENGIQLLDVASPLRITDTTQSNHALAEQTGLPRR